MNVKQIVESWLRNHKYDGLCNKECGCRMGDLAPCGEISEECVAGYMATTDEGWIIWPAPPTILDEKRKDPEFAAMYKEESAKIAKSERALEILNALHDVLKPIMYPSNGPITLVHLRKAIQKIEEESDDGG